jgi:aspartyl-tRNA(Asn)/glutamyl-tRNA(Gln) amidotransferase subunit C
MSLTQEQILHIARLAKLHIEEGEIASYQKDLNPIMDYVNILNSVPEESLKKAHESIGLGLIPRPDEVIRTIDREDLLACSSQKIIHHQIAVDNISSRV